MINWILLHSWLYCLRRPDTDFESGWFTGLMWPSFSHIESVSPYSRFQCSYSLIVPFWALITNFSIRYFSLTFKSATFNFNWSIYSFKSPTSFSADQPPSSWSHQAHSSACPVPQSTPSLHQHCPACPFDSFCTLFSTGRQAA